MDLKASPKNNICAYLDSSTRNAAKFVDIIAFLRRSRIATAISFSCTPYLTHQRSFWSSAEIDCTVTPHVIRGTVGERVVVVSAEHIRRVCGFQDLPEHPITLDKYLVRGCLLRCKYDGDLAIGVLNKANLCPQFKYLCHVLLHCLGSRRGGFDELRETLQSAFVALVLNIPYNFSEMVFTHMKENVSFKRDKMYLMYPRFLQMIFDEQLPDLPKISTDVIRLEHMTDTTLNRVLSYRGKDTKPQSRCLFGHLINPDYVAPLRMRWRHEDSDSDVEDIIVPDMDDDDFGDDHTAPATTTQATVSVSAEIIEPISAFASEEIPPFCSADVNLYDIHFTDGSNSKNTKDEFMTTRVGTRLEGFKRRREEPSDEQQARDIDDVDIVPNFASILIPSTTQAPAQSSVATKKKGASKRQRFILQRKTECVSTATTTIVTSATMTQVSSLSGSRTFTTHPVTSVSQPPSIPAVVFTSSTIGPSISRTERSIPTVSIVEQLNNLNSLVIRLMEKSHQQDLAIAQITPRNSEQDALLLQSASRNLELEASLLKASEDHHTLSLTVQAHEERILSLELENKRLSDVLKGLKNSTPHLEGKPAESDSDDSNSDDDDKEKVDFEGSDNDGDADDGAGDAALLWSLQRNNQSLPRPPM